jgi:glutathione synthase/RimK-type ligase-like ATP-grasp enzyme
VKFYCLHQGFYEGIQERLNCLKATCEKLNIDFVCLNSLNVDYCLLPKLTKNDFLYNVARGGETLETFLLNKEVKTFYRNNPDFVVSNSNTIKYSVIHDRANLPVPKTIYNITPDRRLLRKYVDYLEGFPLIIKNQRSTRGIGTIKVESWQSLISIIDYLMTTNEEFILRQFINNPGTARLIVLGDKVIASVFRENQFEDFRVSSGEKSIVDYPKEYNERVNNLAIQATHLANLETAGVDIVFDEAQNPYLLEINFPHNFVRPQQVTGVNIAEKMLLYLLEKSKK